jgi:hypothetical protein
MATLSQFGAEVLRFRNRIGVANEDGRLAQRREAAKAQRDALRLRAPAPVPLNRFSVTVTGPHGLEEVSILRPVTVT